MPPLPYQVAEGRGVWLVFTNGTDGSGDTTDEEFIGGDAELALTFLADLAAVKLRPRTPLPCEVVEGWDGR